MKNFKIIASIIGLLGLTDSMQASRTLAKTVGKVATAVGTAGVLGYSNAYSDAQKNQPSYDASKTNSFSPSQSYYAPMYEKYNQSNTSKAFSTSPTILDFNKNMQPESKNSNNQAVAIDMNAVDTKSSDTNPSASNLDFFNSPQSIAQRYLQLKNLNKSMNTTQAKPIQLVEPQQKSTPSQESVSEPIIAAQNENLTAQIQEPVQSNQESVSEPIIVTQNGNLTAQIQEPIQNNQESVANIEQTHNAPSEIAQPATIQTQHQPAQSYDANQNFIDQQIKNISQAIENWPYYHDEFTSEQAHDDILQKSILTSLGIKNDNESLQVYDPQTDLKIIDTLLETNKENLDVVRVLNATAQTIANQAAAQKVTPIQANNAINHYLGKNPEALASVASLMLIKPIFDQTTGTVTNLPPVEKIIEIALQNPSAQAYKALEACKEATNIAIYAARNSDQALISQLTTFQSKMTTTLQNPKLTRFQSWGAYGYSFVPSTRNILNAPGIKNLTLETTLNTVKSLASGDNASPSLSSKLMPAAISMTGVGNMTVSQVAQKVGLVPADAPTPPVAPAPGSIQAHINKAQNYVNSMIADFNSEKETLNFDMSTQEINTIVAKNSSNKAIAQTYTPAMLNDIFVVMDKKPQVNAATGVIENMPSVDDIMKTALNNPSQQAFNALQSALEATRIAMYAHRSESSIMGSTANYKQLQSFAKQITTILQDPKFTQFHSWTTQATSYIATFAPSLKTVLDTTGLGKLTINQAINTVTKAPRIIGQVVTALSPNPVVNTAANAASSLLIEGAVHASGIPNMTLAQAYDYVYPQ